jgi:SAM-dependent methyltransferase
MHLGERLLGRLSRNPGGQERNVESVPNSPMEALARLRSAFPDLETKAAGRRVLDFGCGRGFQAVALAAIGAVEAVGIDTNERVLVTGRDWADRHGVADRVHLVTTLGAEHEGRFDVVVSQDSMEHFLDPAAVLEVIRRALRPGGELLMSFSPPWFAPYGAHMHYFTSVPWVHLLFSERTVMAVRRRYRNDGAIRYEDVEGGLNRMSVAKFERLVRDSGLELTWRRYVAVKRIPLVTAVPGLRELFVNQVDCVLRRPAAALPAA